TSSTSRKESHMSASPRRRMSEAEREQQRAHDRELTVRAVEQLRSSAGWQAWLRLRAATGLRRYSIRNQLLIALQELDSHCLLEKDGYSHGPGGSLTRRCSANRSEAQLAGRLTPRRLDRA